MWGALPCHGSSSTRTATLPAATLFCFWPEASPGRAARPANIHARLITADNLHPVSVASSYTKRSEYPTFRIPQGDGFETSYVGVLEGDLPSFDTRNMIGKDAISVLVPNNKESFFMLSSYASTKGGHVTLAVIDPQVRITKGVMMGCPLRMPLSLLRHPQVESATHCQTSRTHEDTRQVLLSLRGPLPLSLTLGKVGHFLPTSLHARVAPLPEVWSLPG